MVLRKRAPPHLYNLSQGNARSEPRSPILRTSPTSVSVTSSSPKRLTRPRRAQSSPHPSRIPSQESIYSPDLNTSPAFDLMSLEQAQRSPIRTSSTDTPNPWADELVERPGPSHHDAMDSAQQPPTDSNVQGGETVDNKKADRVPAIVLEGTQRRMAATEWQVNQGVNDASEWECLGQPPVQLQSNNPFLKVAQPEKDPWNDGSSRGSNASSLARDDASGGLGQDEGYITMAARLSLFDQAESESPWADEPGNSPTQHQPSHILPNGRFEEVPATHTPPHSVENAPPQLQPQPPLLHTRISTPGTVSTATTGSSHVLIDLDDSSKQEVGSDTNKLTSPVLNDATVKGDNSQSALQTLGSDGVTSSHEARASEPDVLTKPPPPPARSAMLSEAEIRQQPEKQTEPYSIRHINWQDSTGTLRESPVLVQNKNGPCPLLALVNALVLRGASQSSPPPIIRALRSKEQISLGLLIEALFDELTTHMGHDEELPDIEALSRFLTMLHTGMNVNPRLTLESNDMPGTFLQTGDIKFYSAFGVPLVHGWIAPPSTEVNAALTRIGQYHEDIQLLPFRKQELEDRVFQGPTLTPEEERTLADIHAIQQFIEVDNATQLSPFGLEHLTKVLQPGSLSILFRNDHFATLYKHPQLHQLFTLVTDAGYSSHAEIAWESLVDVSGSDANFYSGDFRVVGHHVPRDPDPSGPRISSNDASGHRQHSTMSAQEQADADYAYALSLQYQEEVQQRSTNPPQSSSTPAVDNAGNRASSASTGSRFSRQRQSNGRHSQTHLEPNRPVHDEPEEVPPPPYEQAAKSPIYRSPQPSPHNVDMPPPPRSPYHKSQYGRYPERGKDRSKDCIVM